jgi:uncharacterized membrane protein
LKPLPARLIGVLFIAAGLYHVVNPRPYLAMIPPYLPAPAALVLISGLAEIAGGVRVWIAPLRRPAAWGLIALLVAVAPANLHVALHGWEGVNLPRWVLWARLPLQPIFIWIVHRFCIARDERDGTPR